MKAKNRLYLLAVTALALSLNATTGVGQVFNPKDAINNIAVANSPRAKEAFPWLTRSFTQSPRSQEAITQYKGAVAVVKKNSALAASPRMKEQFPELARSAVTTGEGTVATRTGSNLLPEVRRNSALAASPRMKELYPELVRGAEKSIEIAPLK